MGLFDIFKKEKDDYTRDYNYNSIDEPKPKAKPDNWITFNSQAKPKCICNEGMIECLGCKGEDDIKYKLRCAGCNGVGKVTCGKCGGLEKSKKPKKPYPGDPYIIHSHCNYLLE